MINTNGVQDEWEREEKTDHKGCQWDIPVTDWNGKSGVKKGSELCAILDSRRTLIDTVREETVIRLRDRCHYFCFE